MQKQEEPQSDERAERVTPVVPPQVLIQGLTPDMVSPELMSDHLQKNDLTKGMSQQQAEGIVQVAFGVLNMVMTQRQHAEEETRAAIATAAAEAAAREAEAARLEAARRAEEVKVKAENARIEEEQKRASQQDAGGNEERDKRKEGDQEDEEEEEDEKKLTGRALEIQQEVAAELKQQAEERKAVEQKARNEDGMDVEFQIVVASGRKGRAAKKETTLRSGETLATSSQTKRPGDAPAVAEEPKAKAAIKGCGAELALGNV